jgi:hypothetical protein
LFDKLHTYPSLYSNISFCKEIAEMLVFPNCLMVA